MRTRRPRGRKGLTRRVFIHRLTFFGGGVILLGAACKKTDEPPAASKRPKVLTTSHLTFTNDEFAALSAACERVVPKDEDPGAIDAQVPQYIDRMLQSPDLRQMKDDFLAGVAALDRRSQRMFKLGYAGATATQQDELLTLFKNSRPGTGEAHFYELLVVLTLEGLLGDPSYGGNKNGVGWALVGFSMVGHEAAEPPPGYDGTKHLHHGKH